MKNQNQKSRDVHIRIPLSIYEEMQRIIATTNGSSTTTAPITVTDIVCTAVTTYINNYISSNACSVTSNNITDEIIIAKQIIKDMRKSSTKTQKRIKKARTKKALSIYESKLTFKNNKKKLNQIKNHYYEQIKSYCLRTDTLDTLINILRDPDPKILQSEYSYTIYKALDIPLDHTLTYAEWCEISEYFI